MTRYLSIPVLLGALALASPAAGAQADASAAAQPPVQARPGGPDDAPRTDQTVDVTRGTRLVMSNNAGEIVVRAWDRDAVRVEAMHGPREQVDVQVAEMVLRVRARTERGPQGLVDCRITVPRWMPVNLTGTYLEADVEGTAAEVTIETVRGTARVRGGTGAVSARSVQGDVYIENAAGRVAASSVNELVRLTNVSGDVSAESTNGDIVMSGMKSSTIEASTVNGDVSIDGDVQSGGAYRVTTHNGDIRVGLGGGNATVFVRTFRGGFNADFPVTLPDGQSRRDGNMRFNFTLGDGGARVELQSFGGDIFVARNRLPARQVRRSGASPSIAPPAPPAPPAVPRPPAPRPPGDAWSGTFDADAWARDWSEAWQEEWQEEWEHTWEHTWEHAFEGWDGEIDAGAVAAVTPDVLVIATEVLDAVLPVVAVRPQPRQKQ